MTNKQFKAKIVAESSVKKVPELRVSEQWLRHTKIANGDTAQVLVGTKWILFMAEDRDPSISDCES